ncbi:uncharacterized protein BN646_00290 [Parabacteroides sp. CAG:409]|nr:uncharacterized protein BN646_00290 [Parabacteroides sp. CAG:409]
MLTDQTTRLGSQLEDRQTWCIIHINGSIIKFLNLIVHLFPFVFLQPSALDLLTRNLTDIHYKTIYELDVTHFQREQSYRCIEVDSHVLGHRKDKSCFTHSRTGSNNNQVRILPTGSNLVKSVKACTQTTQTFFLIGCIFQHLQGFLDNRINLRHVFLYVTLRNLKQLSFGFLHQIIHISGLIESFRLNLRRERNQFTCQVFLGNDPGMVFDMRATRYFTCQLSYIIRTAHLI